jgi:hypothetical protein
MLSNVPWLEQAGDGLAEQLTVRRGAEIVVLPDGQIAEIGTHESCLSAAKATPPWPLSPGAYG